MNLSAVWDAAPQLSYGDTFNFEVMSQIFSENSLLKFTEGRFVGSNGLQNYMNTEDFEGLNYNFKPYRDLSYLERLALTDSAKLESHFGSFGSDLYSGQVNITSVKPPAAGLSTSGHSYDADTGILSLAGFGFNSLDVMQLDWEKFSWDIDGTGAAPIFFHSEIIENALAQSDTEIAISLSSLGFYSLVAAEGFGGRVATGGIEDKLNAESGFLKNALGVISIEPAAVMSQGSFAFADETVPELILFSALPNTGRMKAGDKILITATASESLQPNGHIEVTFNSGGRAILWQRDILYTDAEADADESGVITAGGVKVEAAENELVGIYKVSPRDVDVADLTVISYTIGTVTDFAGDYLSSETDITEFADLGDIAIDLTAPSLINFTATPNTGIMVIGDTVTISATVDEAMRADTSFEVTLNSGATVPLIRDAIDPQVFTGTFTITDSDADVKDLRVLNYTPDTAVDIAGNSLEVGTNLFGFSDLGSIEVRSTIPIAGLATTGHEYNVITGKLSLSGTDFLTVDAEYLDWTKFSWDVDGTGANSVIFQPDYVSSVTIKSNNSLEAFLSTAGRDAISSSLEFGGISATDRIADKIDVGIGFLRDGLGRISNEISATLENASVTLADETAPKLIAFAATPDSGIKTTSDQIVIQASVDEVMRSGTSIDVTLNSGVVVTLTRDLYSATLFTGTYTVAETDIETPDLAIISYSPGTAVDLSGNALKSGIDISGFSDLGSIEIDNTPPTAKFSDGHTYDVSTGILSLFGIDFSTMDEDNLDWTKFSWDVDGTGENSVLFQTPFIDDTTVTLGVPSPTPVFFGSEFQINTYTTGDQRHTFNTTQDLRAVSALTDGGFVAVWTSFDQDGSDVGVYGQRYDASGSALGAEFRVNTYTDGPQAEGQIAALADGGFIITWASRDQDGSDFGVFGQRYDASGSPQGTEFEINSYTSEAQGDSSITSLTDGGFVVTWQSFGQDGSDFGIFGQKYNASGAPSGAEFQINTYSDGVQMVPSVTSLSDGGFVVIWQSDGQDGDGFGIYGQRYDTSGVASGAEYQINTDTVGNQLYPSTTSLSDGSVVVAWASSDADDYGIFGQRYDASGASLGAEFQINTYTTSTQENPSITNLSDGGFVVTWQSFGQDISDDGIYGQRFAADGTMSGVEFQVNTETNGEQSSPAVTGLSNGKLVVTWVSADQDGDGLGIYGQILSTTQDQLDVTLSTSGQNALQAVEGFGGIAATDRTADKLDVESGFFRDTLGRISTEAEATLDNGTITLADEIAPSLIAFNATPNTGEVNIGDEIVLNATVSEDMRVGTDIELTLNSGGVVTLTRDSSAANIYTGTYTVAAEDTPVSDLEVASYNPGTAVDLSGNALSGNTDISGFSDLTAPKLISFAASPSSGTKKITNEIELSATASEDMQADTQIEVTLNSGAVVALTRDSTNAREFNGTYTVAIGDTDVLDLAIESYSVGTAVDLSGLPLVVGTDITSFADLGSIAIDATPPFVTSFSSNSNPVGPAFQINTYTDGAQTVPSITNLPDGGFVTIWSSYGQDGSQNGIYGQRYDGSGSKVNSEFQISTHTSNHQYQPSVTSLAGGGFVATWVSSGQDGSSGGVYGQQYDASGNAAGSEFQINSHTVGSQSQTAATSLADGGFVVTWQSGGQDAGTTGIYGQRYDPYGSPVDTEFQVNSYTANAQSAPSLTSFGVDSFVVIWSSKEQDGSSEGIYGQRYDASGHASGSEFLINTHVTGKQTDPSVTSLIDGGFVAVWSSYGQDGDGYGIFGQRYDASGLAIGVEFQVNSYSGNHQYQPAVISEPDEYLVFAVEFLRSRWKRIWCLWPAL